MNHYEGANAVGSEEEANTAAALLQKMLIKYNISAEELNDSMSEKAKEREIVEEYMSWYTKKSIGGEWEFNLMHVICKWNLCKVFYSGGKKSRRMMILGEYGNVQFVKWMHDMLKERYVKFSKQKYAEHCETLDWLMDPIGLDTFQRRYLLGCCDGLDKKFREIDAAGRQEDQTFNNQCTALVLRNNAALDTFVAQKYGKIGSAGAGQDIRKGAAYINGVKDGYKTDINKPIANEKAANTKLLG